MLRSKQVMTYVVFVTVALLIRGVFADSTILPADAALTSLQKREQNGENVFLVQGELDPVIRQGGGGACASAAAIDAIQAIRLMVDRPPLTNPHQAALRAIKQQSDLLNGRVTNEQFVVLLQGYAEEYLDGVTLQVDVATTPNGPFSPVAVPWPVSDGPNLRVDRGELKIVTFTFTEASGRLLGRHFVLLKQFVDHELSVVDPSRPLKDIRYTLVGRDLEGWGRRYFLNPPPSVATTTVLEVDTIFTLRIVGVQNHSKGSDDILELTKKVDETAHTLRASGDLRSPRKWREVTAEFGLPGIDLPVEFGGSGWSASKTLDVFLAAGRHDLNCRDVVGGAHVRPLLRSSHPKIQEIVRQVVLGEAYVAICMTEPHAGSDYHSITSRARRVEGGYVLDGEKRYVARLEQATHVIVFTQPVNGEPHGLSAFVLPIESPGLQPYSFGAHGLKGNSFGGMRLQNVHVEEWQMIGDDGEGDAIFRDHFRYWRLMQVAAALGTAERALAMMVDRLVEREAYGAPIGRFSHLQQAVGKHTTELRMAKALAREAATMIDQGRGEEADAIINGLKAEGVEIALATVDSAMRAFGAEGYSDRVDLGDRLQDLHGLRIADGTTDVMRMSVVARSYGDKGRRLWEMAVRGGR